MSKSKIFVIMPFEEIFFEVYELLKNEFCSNYEFSHAGDLGGQQNILKDIIHGINEADIIIADLSTLNANVFYELGIAHTLNKRVIIITQSLDDLPFDLRSYRANAYNTTFSKIKKLTEKLSDLLAGAITGDIPFGSPVADFLPQLYEYQKTDNNIIKDKKEVHHIEKLEEEKGGFMDYICDLNEGIGEMGDVIETITDDVKELSEGTIEKGNEFKSINGNLDSSQFSNRRKILREMAKIINNFAIKLKPNNKRLDLIWNKIENNFLSLLDNPWMESEENKQGLVGVLRSLIGMQESIKSSKEVTEELISSSITAKGLERSLDSAIASMCYEIEMYNNISDNAVAIIDRIIEKSKITVKNLDKVLKQEL